MGAEEAIKAYEAMEAGTAGNPGTDPAVPVPGATPIEEYEYYLGDKASKLAGNAEFALKHNGQVQRVPASKLINGYRLSSNLEKKLQETESRYAPMAKEYEGLKKTSGELEPYRALQTWSQELETKDPGAYAYLLSQIENVKNGTWKGSSDPGVSQAFTAMRKELDDIKGWKSGFEEQQKEVQIQEDMKAINSEAEAFAKEFEINLDDQDAEGASLKTRIIKFGLEHSLPDFESAALKFLKSTLLEKATAKGRSEAVKGVKGDNMAGIISRSSTPSNGQSRVDPRRMSSEERRAAALAEYEALTHG